MSEIITKKYPLFYFAYIIVVLSSWFYFLFTNNQFYVLTENIPVMITMIFGSFIAGSSPEGSASIAFPIFTLYLNIAPDIARNFAFAIQSIGMTSATIYILNKKLPVERNYIFFVTAGGILGLILGTYYLVPLVQPKLAKLLFVSLWLSFGLVLFYLNKKGDKNINSRILGLKKNDVLILLTLGVLGGFISSVFGTGINIFSFCFIVVYYQINEKVAAKSSIIIMTIETIVGFFLHGIIIKDISAKTYEMWIACIPIVIFFAPLGTYFLNRISHRFFSNFLYFIFIIQYAGAIYVIRPDTYLSIFSFGIILIGIFGFYFISKHKRIS